MLRALVTLGAGLCLVACATAARQMTDDSKGVARDAYGKPVLAAPDRLP